MRGAERVRIGPLGVGYFRSPAVGFGTSAVRRRRSCQERRQDLAVGVGEAAAGAGGGGGRAGAGEGGGGGGGAVGGEGRFRGGVPKRGGVRGGGVVEEGGVAGAPGPLAALAVGAAPPDAGPGEPRDERPAVVVAA